MGDHERVQDNTRGYWKVKEGVGDHRDQGELDKRDEDGEAGDQSEARGWGMGPHPDIELLGLVGTSISNNYLVL